MSHDIYLQDNKNYCDTCKRVDTVELAEYNVSYNHCWIWYQDFDTKYGFKAMYDVPLFELVPRLEKLKAKMILLNGGVPIHEMNPDGSIKWSNKLIRTIDDIRTARDDGWANTMFNAYRCVEHILRTSKYYLQEHPHATWYGINYG